MSWAEIAAGIEAATQEIFGERVRLTPLTTEFPVEPDPDRPAFEAICVEHHPADYAAALAGMPQKLPYHEGRVEIARAALPEDWDLRKGDRVELVERPSSPSYHIARVDRSRVERIALILAPVGE